MPSGHSSAAAIRLTRPIKLARIPRGGTRLLAQVGSPGSVALNATDAVGALLGRYRAFWPKRTDDQLAARIADVGSLFRSSPIKLAQAVGLRDSVVTPFDDPNITVEYQSTFDDLRVDDRTRLPDTRPAADIGEKAARDLAKKTILALADKGAVQRDHFDVNAITTGRHQREEYAVDGKPTTTYTVEYRFQLLRKLNGSDLDQAG